jgi:hypothetical protein
VEVDGAFGGLRREVGCVVAKLDCHRFKITDQ